MEQTQRSVVDYFGDPGLAVLCVKSSIEYRVFILNAGKKTKFEKAMTSAFKNMCTHEELKQYNSFSLELKKRAEDRPPLASPSSSQQKTPTPSGRIANKNKEEVAEEEEQEEEEEDGEEGGDEEGEEEDGEEGGENEDNEEGNEGKQEQEIGLKRKKPSK